MKHVDGENGRAREFENKHPKLIARKEGYSCYDLDLFYLNKNKQICLLVEHKFPGGTVDLNDDQFNSLRDLAKHERGELPLFCAIVYVLGANNRPLENNQSNAETTHVQYLLTAANKAANDVIGWGSQRFTQRQYLDLLEKITGVPRSSSFTPYDTYNSGVWVQSPILCNYFAATFDFQDGNGLVPAHKHVNGDGWVADTAEVEEAVYVGPNAKVFGKARVLDNARVYGKALVYGDAEVYGNAKVYGKAWVCDDARVFDNAKVCEDARVFGNAQVCEDARVFGNAQVYGDALVYSNALIYGNAQVCDDSQVFDDAQVHGNARVCDSAKVFALEMVQCVENEPAPLTNS